jgi:hypothetical protein
MMRMVHDDRPVAIRAYRPARRRFGRLDPYRSARSGLLGPLTLAAVAGALVAVAVFLAITYPLLVVPVVALGIVPFLAATGGAVAHVDDGALLSLTLLADLNAWPRADRGVRHLAGRPGGWLRRR